MKKIVLFSLMMACLPFLSMAQKANDDLYFIPKKTEKKAASGTQAKVVIETTKAPTTVYASPGSTVVVKDVKGNVRDVDEYNRRYTSRDNTFSMENDTLFIEEKSFDERGEWVNGFEGTQSDYEYAMRIVRFRNPRYAIPVSSPLYWDVVYGLPSWEWNVYDDGLYAYVFPTYSNSLWWDWRFSWGWSWRSPWYYNSWYRPGFHFSYWHHPHFHHPHYHHHHHHHHPHYGWGGVGGTWGGGRKQYGSSALRPGIHAGRYASSVNRGNTSAPSQTRRVSTAGNRNSRDAYVNGSRPSSASKDGNVRNSSGRVVTPKEGSGSASVRPQRSAVRSANGGQVTTNRETTGVRSNNSYTRPTQGKSSTYSRQSSTRSTVNNSGSSVQRRSGAASRNGYSSGSSSRNSSNRSSSGSSYSSGRSGSRSTAGSFSSSGGGGRSGSGGSIGGGGGHSSGGGGGSRSGGGGRR